jgi:hypothetical protein
MTRAARSLAEAYRIERVVHRVRLVHWSSAEAEARAAGLAEAGYKVEVTTRFSPEGLRSLRSKPPAAVVIDLSRAPSHGRAVAVAIRRQKATRHLPLVLVGGDPDWLAGISDLLPDAVYTTWGRIRSALRAAIARPPVVTLVPSSVMAPYAHVPLARKLGIKPNAVVVLAGAPAGFEKTLAPLPEGVTVRCRDRGRRDITLWFVCWQADLLNGLERMKPKAEAGGLWIVWPKQASGLASDLTQAVVRKPALSTGLVDFKVCALDATWTGLRFTRRK